MKIDLSGVGAAYLRVSDQDQVATNQRNEIQSWLAAHLANIAPSNWLTDEGWSRSEDDTRPAFQRLLGLIRKRKVDWVVVFALDRFGSGTALGIMGYLNECERNGVRLFSVSEESTGNLASSAVATAVMTLLKASQSVEELDRKSARSLTGHKQYAGNAWGDEPAYGYDKACVGPDGREKWRLIWERYEGDILIRTRRWVDGRTDEYRGLSYPRPDEGDRCILVPSIRKDRVEAVRLAYQWWTTEEVSCGTIARRLDSLPGIGKPPTRAGKWYDIFVRGLLGRYCYGYGVQARNTTSHAQHFEHRDGRLAPVEKLPGSRAKQGRRRQRSEWIVPPDQDRYQDFALVTPEVWEAAYAKLHQRKGNPVARNNEYWLEGLAFCECGRRLVGHVQRAGGKVIRHGYRCSSYGHPERSSKQQCRLNYISTEKLEGVLQRWLDDAGERLDILRKVPSADLLAWAEVYSQETGDPLANLLPPGTPAGDAARAIDTALATYAQTFGKLWSEMKAKGKPVPKGATKLAAASDKTDAGRLAKTRAELAKAREEYETMVGNFALATSERQRAAMQQLIDKQEGKIRELEAAAVPLGQTLTEAREGVLRAQKAQAEVRRVLRPEGQGGPLVRNGEALQRVVRRVVVRYRAEDKGKQKRSVPVAVLVEPVGAGEVSCDVPSEAQVCPGSRTGG